MLTIDQQLEQLTALNHQQLEALNEAHKLLSRVQDKLCSDAAMQPWRKIDHARLYIRKEADKLLARIFEKE